MTRQQILTLVRAGSVVLVLAAIVAQAYEGIQANVFDPTRFFAYFTIQSNLIGVAAFIWLLRTGRGRRSRALELLRGAAVVYLTVTFFVVIALLSNIDVGLQLVWVDVVVHKIFPIVIVADWLLDPPHHRLTFRDGLLWLVYPIIWAVVTMIRGAIDGWYPYPFLNPANGGYGTVAVTIVAISVAVFALAAVVIWLGNRRRDAGPELQPAT